MTSQSAIFDRRVNPIAPEEASLKNNLNKIYLKNLKFLLLTGELWKMYINQSENSKHKFQNLLFCMQ